MSKIEMLAINHSIFVLQSGLRAINPGFTPYRTQSMDCPFVTLLSNNSPNTKQAIVSSHRMTKARQIKRLFSIDKRLLTKRDADLNPYEQITVREKVASGQCIELSNKSSQCAVNVFFGNEKSLFSKIAKITLCRAKCCSLTWIRFT